MRSIGWCNKKGKQVMMEYAHLVKTKKTEDSYKVKVFRVDGEQIEDLISMIEREIGDLNYVRPNTTWYYKPFKTVLSLSVFFYKVEDRTEETLLDELRTVVKKWKEKHNLKGNPCYSLSPEGPSHGGW